MSVKYECAILKKINGFQSKPKPTILKVSKRNQHMIYRPLAKLSWKNFDTIISNKLVSMTEVIESYNTVLRWCCTYMRCSRTRYSGNTLFSCPIDAGLEYRYLVQVGTNNAVWRFRLVQVPSLCLVVWLGISWIVNSRPKWLNVSWFGHLLVIWYLYLIEYKILIK